ncbi:hypothetical protein PhaeoP128_00139 [Phaeobacter gallaeciensis]|nr:hypothetical protein PhaeoP129_00139 [Phaeobacter gallaeciensis]ATF20918.1 hypothetical protein PhaeoP128_00139 [Phaeobacter gallaeciensis]
MLSYSINQKLKQASQYVLRLALLCAKADAKQQVRPEKWCPGGCSKSGLDLCAIRFSSRYRHRSHGKHQQNMGYQPRGVTVNRHDLFYGLFYGWVRPFPPPGRTSVLGLGCTAVRRGYRERLFPVPPVSRRRPEWLGGCTLVRKSFRGCTSPTSCWNGRLFCRSTEGARATPPP